MDFTRISQLVSTYFKKLDEDIDRLSHLRESLVTGLPSWFLVSRRITVGYLVQENLFTIRAIPDKELQHDDLQSREIHSQTELDDAIAPIPLRVQLPFVNIGVWTGDPIVVEQGNPFATPVFAPVGLLGMVSNDEMVERFLSPDAATEAALTAWELAEFGLDQRGESIHHQMQLIFNRFSALIRRKSFFGAAHS
jgi:hypothetical protein